MKAKLELIIRRSMLSVASTEHIVKTANKIIKLYEPLIVSLHEANKEIVYLQQAHLKQLNEISRLKTEIDVVKKIFYKRP